MTPQPSAREAGTRPLRVALVAGESSGDLIGAGLIRAVKDLRPGSVFEGIGGPQMKDAGCTIHWPAERLAAFGLADVLAHLPDGLRIRSALTRRLLADPPDVFVGIDAPAFKASCATSPLQVSILMGMASSFLRPSITGTTQSSSSLTVIVRE